MKPREWARYLLRVMGTFVVLGPLLPILPGLSNPFFAIGAWRVGALPALYAGLYYFALTCWWYAPRFPARSAYHFGLFGLLGACCGMLGIFTNSSLPVVQHEFDKLIFSSPVFSFVLGAVGGLGSALVVVWLSRRPAKMTPVREA